MIARSKNGLDKSDGIGASISSKIDGLKKKLEEREVNRKTPF